MNQHVLDLTASPDQINGFLQIWKANGGDMGKIHDGYHSINELYEHRFANYIALCRLFDAAEHLATAGEQKSVWKTKTHFDGSTFNGWFVMGIFYTKEYMITYHLPMSKWDECGFATELERVPEFDGHTSADVLERLKLL